MRGGRAVRETLWIGISETVTTLAAANTATLINALNAPALALTPFTIVRTVGFMGIRSDQTGVSETYDGAIGFSVVTAQALAIGITAVPTPWTDQGSDAFYVHQVMMQRFLFITGAGVESGMLSWKEYDSRAMRKVNDDEDIAFVAETSSLSTGAVIHHAARMLVKLH
jgi:hypothetical protein